MVDHNELHCVEWTVQDLGTRVCVRSSEGLILISHCTDKTRICNIFIQLFIHSFLTTEFMKKPQGFITYSFLHLLIHLCKLFYKKKTRICNIFIYSIYLFIHLWHLILFKKQGFVTYSFHYLFIYVFVHSLITTDFIKKNPRICNIFIQLFIHLFIRSFIYDNWCYKNTRICNV